MAINAVPIPDARAPSSFTENAEPRHNPATPRARQPPSRQVRRGFAGNRRQLACSGQLGRFVIQRSHHFRRFGGPQAKETKDRRVKSSTGSGGSGSPSAPPNIRCFQIFKHHGSQKSQFIHHWRPSMVKTPSNALKTTASSETIAGTRCFQVPRYARRY